MDTLHQTLTAYILTVIFHLCGFNIGTGLILVFVGFHNEGILDYFIAFTTFFLIQKAFSKVYGTIQKIIDLLWLSGLCFLYAFLLESIKSITNVYDSTVTALLTLNKEKKTFIMTIGIVILLLMYYINKRNCR